MVNPVDFIFRSYRFHPRRTDDSFLGIVFTLFLMGVLANTFLGGHWIEYSFADYFSGFFMLIGSMIARPIDFNIEIRREQKELGVARSNINLWPILRGIVIAVPIVARSLRHFWLLRIRSSVFNSKRS